tara:strand:- start:82195 stop:83040 length:846 start_codon:yes stop_codon:yes gene_type:complete
MQKIAIFIILGVFAIVAFIYFSFDGIAPNRDFPGAKAVKIDQQWNMPMLLEEISGIAWMDKERIACVEDEEAIIFIYNLKTSEVERQIVFGEDGDYEGIALVGEDAYVLRSDGTIFEVLNYLTEEKEVNEIKIVFSKTYNFEGISFDKKRNRLILAIKDKAEKEYKPIYSVDLKTKKLEEEPAYKIKFDDPIFDDLDIKNNNHLIQPSEITVNPKTGEIYILEGTNPKLLILSPNGKPKKLHVFQEEQFPQPEGLTFDDQGNLYISNEGAGGMGNILKVSL